MSLRAIIVGGTLCLTVCCVSAQDCYESSILSPNPFMGNNGEIFKLADNSIWEVKYEYEYLYEYYPSVIVCPKKGKLGIKGKMLNIQKIKAGKSVSSKTKTQEVIESQIDGEFEGWEGETIVKLMNGEIWQQSEYFYNYHYAFMPKVIIFLSNGGYKMKVDGIEKSVGVIKLK